MAAACAQHPEREATGTCARCGVFICGSCASAVDGKIYCPSCAARPDVDWLEAYRQRFLGKRDGWAWLFLVAVPVQLLYASVLAWALVGGDGRARLALGALSALAAGAAANGVLWFTRVRAARLVHLGLAAGFSALLTTQFPAGDYGGFALVLLPLAFLWGAALAPFFSVRSKLFFRLAVSREALLKDYRRMEDNRIARWGTLAGVVGLALPFFCLLALTLGGVGLKRVDPNAVPPVGNKGAAIASLALGALGLATTALWLWQTRLFGLLD